MDTVTYPQKAVIDEVNGKFVPAKLESAKNPDVARGLGVRWLPGLVVCDSDGRAANAQIGFLPPEDLITELTFGRAIIAMGTKHYEEAHRLFQQVVEKREHDRAPEAAFWWGVSRYRHMKDFSAAMREPWGMILERWPRSEWARKVAFASKYDPEAAER
jgi:thioredoxin-like negative regulator of GroEL